MNMIGSTPEVPPPAQLHLTLRRITETLARELTNPTHRAPDWSEFEWTVARAVAAMHGVSPLLSHTLPWQGPRAWTQFLAEQRVHTASRQLRMQTLLLLIGKKASEAGISVTALKGVALQSMGLYAVGDRPMADIDLLVRPADGEIAADILAALGFCLSRESWSERVFCPLDESEPAECGEHANNSLKIELHERICERLPWRITEVSEAIFPVRPHPGLNDYPSKAALMLHLLLHAAGSIGFSSLRLLQLHDLALLSDQMSDADWSEVLGYSSHGLRLWWAYPPLELASRYYPAKVPTRVLAALAHDCPYYLRTTSARRTLYDVSYSYLWVKAFPGIEWCQSIPELVGYVVSRVRPSAKHMRLRECVAASQAYGKHGEWSNLSQGRRVLRWVLSRQTRPLTMHAVSAALAQST
jgi:hypothetical protein